MGIEKPPFAIFLLFEKKTKSHAGQHFFFEVPEELKLPEEPAKDDQ